MPDQTRNRTELLADYADNADRSITPETHRGMVKSFFGCAAQLQVDPANAPLSVPSGTDAIIAFDEVTFEIDLNAVIGSDAHIAFTDPAQHGIYLLTLELQGTMGGSGGAVKTLLVELYADVGAGPAPTSVSYLFQGKAGEPFSFTFVAGFDTRSLGTITRIDVRQTSTDGFDLDGGSYGISRVAATS